MPTVIEWATRLEAKIEEQKQYAEPYERRYCNEHVLPFIAQEYREVYGTRVDSVMFTALEAPRTGMAAIGIDALTERLTLTGASSDDPATAEALKAAWEDSDLDVMHREATRESLIKRVSLGAVARAANDPGRAIMTIEAAEQAAVHRMQGPPYDVDGYMKIWTDEWTAKRHALLQIPAGDYDLTESEDQERDPEGSQTWSRWRIVGMRPRVGPVPVVEFAHRPRLLKDPVSEIERIATEIDIVDLIEGLMVFAGHFGAVPIRYATGLTIERDPNDPTQPRLGPDGKPLIGFKPRADHFWSNSNPDAKFGQLEPAGLASFVEWSTHATRRVRALTSVASSYYNLEVKSHMSAELLKTDEAPMVRRILGMGRDGNYGQAWRKGLTHMMRIEGHRGRVKPTWTDPQTRIDSLAMDAFQKGVASGLGPQTTAEQLLGWAPDVVAAAIKEAEDRLSRGMDPFGDLDPSTRAELKLTALPGGSTGGTGAPEPAASA